MNVSWDSKGVEFCSWDEDITDDDVKEESAGMKRRERTLYRIILTGLDQGIVWICIRSGIDS
jgi:hypothetical protein